MVQPVPPCSVESQVLSTKYQVLRVLRHLHVDKELEMGLIFEHTRHAQAAEQSIMIYIFGLKQLDL